MLTLKAKNRVVQATRREDQVTRTNAIYLQLNPVDVVFEPSLGLGVH
jgi:hypothetical protein